MRALDEQVAELLDGQAGSLDQHPRVEGVAVLHVLAPDEIEPPTDVAHAQARNRARRHFLVSTRLDRHFF